MILLAGLAATIIIGGLLITSLITKNLAPSKKRMGMEIQRMKEDMDLWAGELIPVNKEELELFSLGQDKQLIRKGITTTAKGLFTTIYHEAVMAYSYRQYLGNNDKANGLLYARTAEHEYTYWISKGIGTLFIDGQEVGTLSLDGKLRGKRTGKEIARIDKEQTEFLPVRVGNRELGSISKKATSTGDGLHDRAFEFMQEELNDKEEQLFLALVLKELVTRTVNQ